MKKKIIKDFRPYEAPSIVSDDVDLRDLVCAFINTPLLHNICVVSNTGELSGMINRKRVFKSIFSRHIEVGSRVSSLLQLLTAETSGEIMITHLVTAHEEDTVDEIISKLIAHNIREIPILDDNEKVIGFITILRLMTEWASEQK